MLRLAFDFIITWRETRTRPNAYWLVWIIMSLGIAVPIIRIMLILILLLQ